MAQPSPLVPPWSDLQLLEQRPMRACLEAIAEVTVWLEEVGTHEKWPDKALFALTLCADEALTNVINHAQPEEEKALRIQLLLCQSQEGVALCIVDSGAAFDPTVRASAALAKNLEEAEIGGHGLRLMRHYLHRFEYCRDAGLNWLLLGVDVVRPSPGTAD